MLDIIGPVMVGPSSSHTAGAVRLGLLARQAWGRPIDVATIYLRGSFAATYWGHGTDKGLVAGLLGLAPDDLRIPQAFELARERGMAFSFQTEAARSNHANTARIVMRQRNQSMEVVGSSIGGGAVVLEQLDGLPINLDGQSTALVVVHRDQPGIISAVASEMARRSVNIASMSLHRRFRGQQAVAVLELDGHVDRSIEADVERLCPEGSRVLLIDPLGGE